MVSLTRTEYLLPTLCCLLSASAVSALNETTEELWMDLLAAWREGKTTELLEPVERDDFNDFSYEEVFAPEEEEKKNEEEEEEEEDNGRRERFAEEQSVRGSSLVFVFDSTGSMKSELAQVKSGARKILETLRVHPDVPIHNYIMIPFKDPDIGPVTVTTNHNVFKESMENITAFGGGDCPEVSISALKEALQLSLPRSYIYVFTDASAKDYRLQNEVLSLIQKKKSQVDFVMTGDCGTTTEEGYRAYEKIAETASGQIYRLNKDEVEEVLKYVKVALQSNVVNLLSQNSVAPQKGKPNEHEVMVDNALQEFTISVSGINASLKLTDPKGQSVNGPPKLKSLLDLDNVKIVSVKEPDPGPWKVLIKSDSDYRLRSTGLSGVNFRHGFSAVDINNMRETNYRPLKGAVCYLLIETSDAKKVHNITKVDLVNLNGDIIDTYQLEPVPESEGLYKTKAFLPPTEFFYIGVLGYDKDGRPIKRITTTAINPQSPEKPSVKMSPRVLANLNSFASVWCFVESVVPITIEWYINGTFTGVQNNCSQTCEISFPIEKVLRHSRGNYTCLARNVAGTARSSTALTVIGRGPVVTVDGNVSAFVGETVSIACSVESDIPYELLWSYSSENGSSGALRGIPKGEIFENHTLVLQRLGPEDEGWYTCMANSVEGRAQAPVFLSVKIPLRVIVEPKKISYLSGHSLHLICLASGSSSQMRLEWWKNRTQIKNGDQGIVILEGNGYLNLTIPYALKEHYGVYTCSASTRKESASESSELIYIEKPVVKAGNKTLMTKDGEEITLQCDAAGIPRPVIKWYKGGEEVLNNSRIQVEENGRLIIKWTKASDSGEFSCEATNIAGTDADYIGLFVGTAPVFLQTPKDKKIELNQKGTLPCSAVGVPAPKITWKRTDGTDLNPKNIFILPSGALKILKMGVRDVGEYACVAENVFGAITAEVKIDIYGIEKPVVNDFVSLSEVKGIAGSDLRIPCGTSLGNPPGRVQWFKDGKIIPGDDRTKLEDNGDIILRNSSGLDRGNYTCFVSNSAGNSSRTVGIFVSESPKIAQNDSTSVKGQKGGEIIIPCPAEGYPKPSISWMKDGHPLPVSPNIFQSENGSLIIRNLNEESSGTYMCIGQNSAGSASKAVSVQVQVPPSFVEQVMDESLKIVEGYAVLLNCETDAFPKATVKWFKDGEPLPENRGIFGNEQESFRFVAKVDDNGLYKCTAENEAGTAYKEFNVTVLVPPSIIGSKDGISIKAKAGLPLTLECRVRGVPKPTILWQRNGMYLIQNTSEVTVTDSGLLILGNVTKESSGAYICDAENLAGIMQRNYYVQVYYAPRIRDENLNHSISLKEGEEYSLPCSVEGNPRPLVVWRKNGLLIHDEETENSIILGDNTLVFLQVKQETRGTYKCEATNEEGLATKEYQIEVVSPPSLSPYDQHTRKKVNEGEPVVMTCPISKSIPPSTIQWFKDGKPMNVLLQERSDEAKIKLSEDQRELTIAEAHPSDRGNYSCTATNAAGRADAKFLVDVLMTPHFEEFNHVAHRTILIGGEVVLNCSVSGNPQPKVTWKKESSPIAPDNHPGVFISMDKQHLVIQNGRLHHSGTYICTAVNEVNRKEREFYVSVLEPPLIQGSPHEMVDVISGQNFSLHCPFTGVPQPAVVWSKLGHNKTNLNVSGEYLEMTNAECEDEGIYQCEVTNTAGTKVKKFTVAILEPPDIESHNVLDKLVAPVGGNVSMKCRTKGHPKPDITWLYRGHIIQKRRAKREADNLLENFGELDVSEDGFVTLTISNVTEDYDGIYTVLASNRAGITEKNFELSVLSPPKIPEEFRDTKSIAVARAFPIALKCPAAGNPPPTIRWFLDGAPLLQDPNVIFYQDELHIINSNSNHSGEFLCLAENAMGNATLDFTVQVVGPPSIIKTKSEYIVKENDTLELSCEDPGNENITYSWLYKSLHLANSTRLSIIDNGTRLVISDVNFSDSGEYTCIASNIAGLAKFNYKVLVAEAPVVKYENLDLNKSFEIYHPIKLNCPFVARPHPNLTWYKNGVRTEKNEDGRIQTVGGHLIVSNATAQDVGEYKCIAENPAGIEELVFSVHIYVSAFWGPWSEWSGCSVSCGVGEQTRTRICQTVFENLDERLLVDESHCRGESSETRKCLSSCEVDGGWGNWSDWTPYSSTCGKAVRRKYRFCNNPEPSTDGKKCEGPKIMEEYMTLDKCPSSSEWSEWSAWSECSRSCGGGLRKRHRKCQSRDTSPDPTFCPGPSIELDGCNKRKCLDDWLEWSEWSPCSASCGRGQKKRTRKCGPKGGCEGENLQIKKCTIEKCGVAAVPSSANFQIRGKLNGRNLDQRFDVSIENTETKRIVSANLTDLVKEDKKWFPYAQFLLTPLSWSTAYEKDDADNGFSLTNGQYFSQSDIKFATGEEMVVKHKGEGLDSEGALQVQIEVIGEVPLIEPHATVYIQNMEQDYVQTGSNSLYSNTENDIDVEGSKIPFTLNSSIYYSNSQGTMPYLVEKLSIKDICNYYDSETRDLKYFSYSTIGKSYEKNECPRGFIHAPELQHCRDVDECEEEGVDCGSDGRCENTFGSFTCVCNEGFARTGNSTLCSDIDECSLRISACSHFCHNIPGSYSCSCPYGYYLDEDLQTCIENVFARSELYSHPRSKFSGNYSYFGGPEDDFDDQDMEYGSPLCPPGFFFHDGRCTDRNECLEEMNLCDRDEICLNTLGSYQCLNIGCPHGFAPNFLQKSCKKNCREVKTCRSKSLLSETVIFKAVSLNSSHSLWDILRLDIPPGVNGAIAYVKFRVVESSHLFRVRELRKDGYLYALRGLNKDTLYRVKIEAKCFDIYNAFTHYVEFVVFIILT